MAMEVPGKRRRGRPKRRWMDTIGNDLSEKELSREDTQDRAKWRSLMTHRPHIKVGKDEEKKKNNDGTDNVEKQSKSVQG